MCLCTMLTRHITLDMNATANPRSRSRRHKLSYSVKDKRWPDQTVFVLLVDVSRPALLCRLSPVFIWIQQRTAYQVVEHTRSYSPLSNAKLATAQKFYIRKHQSSLLSLKLARESVLSNYTVAVKAINATDAGTMFAHLVCWWRTNSIDLPTPPCIMPIQ